MTKSSKHSKNIFSASSLDIIRSYAYRAIRAKNAVQKLLSDIKLIVSEDIESVRGADPETRIIHIFNRFHIVATTLRDRYGKRPTIIIDDEKDAQDLLHGLLKLYFEDIRAEEPTESVAGGFSIIDFILKREKIGIEVKMTRKNHLNKEIKEELTLDKDFYRKHSDCSKLFCFVYDPPSLLRNPRGFEVDLSDNISGLETIVIVAP